MFNKIMATALVLLLGLFLPAAANPTCICLGPPALTLDSGCCDTEIDCCSEGEEHQCCGEPECCVLLPELPDGQEPTVLHAPIMVAVPLPLIETRLEPQLVRELSRTAKPLSRPPPPLGVAQHTFGVWRL